MKRFLLVLLTVVAAISAAIAITAFRFEQTVRPNTFVASVPLGGLTRPEAAKKIRIWWEAVRINQLELKNDKLRRPLPPMTPGALGVVVDDDATVALLPLTDLVTEVKVKVGQADYPRQDVLPQFKSVPVDLTNLEAAIRTSAGDPHPASIRFENGNIIKESEVSGFTLEKPRLFDSVVKAVREEQALDLPLVEAPKKLNDESLAAIKEVVMEFSTRFPASNVPRCANIKLAQSKINGKILMPGEIFSYNDTVGPRTLKAGFRLAGVYKNGRHDTGVGGGICQVSTTLYNAALLSNLAIKQRLNHSMPVPYVPVGRDATVDYGSIDLAFENTYPTPIALTSEYVPGKLTFRILGTKDPSLSVKLTISDHKSWPCQVKTVKDPTVAFGKTKVVEKGTNGQSVRVYRKVYQNGVLVRTDSLGTSHYPGGVRIMAVGTKSVPGLTAATNSQASIPPQ